MLSKISPARRFSNAKCLSSSLVSLRLLRRRLRLPRVEGRVLVEARVAGGGTLDVVAAVDEVGEVVLAVAVVA